MYSIVIVCNQIRINEPKKKRLSEFVKGQWVGKKVEKAGVGSKVYAYGWLEAEFMPSLETNN